MHGPNIDTILLFANPNKSILAVASKIVKHSEPLVLLLTKSSEGKSKEKSQVKSKIKENQKIFKNLGTELDKPGKSKR